MKAKASLVRPRWSKVLADLWDNKMRTLLVVSSIAVGVFAVGTIANAYLILSEDIDHSYSQVNPANIQITTDTFDKNFIESIKEIPGVSVANARVKLIDSKFETQGPKLITHWGLSGPAVLKLSAFGALFLAQKNYQYQVKINWLSKPLETVLQKLKILK